MSFYFRRWARSPSVSAVWLCRSAAAPGFLQDPRPMAIPSRGLGHPAPAPAHSRLLPHTVPLQTSPWLLTWGFLGEKACECWIFPRGFTSPHGVMPFASPAAVRAGAQAGRWEPVPLSSPHTPAGSSRPTRPRRAHSGAGAIPLAEGRAAAPWRPLCGERGGTRPRLSRCQDGTL